MKKKIFAVLMALCMVFSMTTVALANDAVGTKGNPEVITTLGGTASQAASETTVHDEAGYWYKYVAPYDGVLAVTSAATSVEDAYTATKIINVTQDNAETTGFNEFAHANEGDELLIQVRSYKFDSNWSPIFDAATITWTAEYSEIGTESTPDTIALENWGSGYMANGMVSVVPGSEGYYYTCESPAEGKFYMYVSTFGTTATNPEIIVTIGGETVKYSESTETKTVMSGRMPEEVKVVAIETEGYGEEITVQIKDNGTGTEAVDVIWNAAIEEPVGSANNPYPITELETTVTIGSYEQFYVELPWDYLYAAEAIKLAGENAVVFVGNPMMGRIVINEDGSLPLEDLLALCENMGNVVGILNQGNETADYTITFDIPEGTTANPEKIEDEAEHTFVEGDGMYYYTWTAPADGIVTISMESTSSWMFSVDNMTSGYWGEYYNSTEGGKEVLEVNAGDELLIYASAYNDSWETVAGTVTTTVDFVESVGGVLAPEAYEDVLTMVNDAIWSGELEEEYIVVNMCDEDLTETVATVVPAEILAAVMEYNETYDTNLPILLVMADYLWYIEGVEDSTPVDLGLTFAEDNGNIPEATIEATAEGNEWGVFSIAHDGDFGFNAVLEFLVDVEDNVDYIGKTVALYWYNDNNELELVGDKCVIDETGIIGFAMTHASDYVMVIEGTAEAATPPAVTPPVEAPKTGDTTNFGLWIAVLGLGVVAIAGSVVMKKREF